MQPVYWPPIEEQFGEYVKYLGKPVLNAGCGSRPIVPGLESVVNFDIEKTSLTDLVADSHELPFRAESFESILSVAVLEHCRRPWEVVREFKRVLRPGGYVVCDVPFMQPVHLAPYDFFRFTEYGLRSLFEDAGFETVNLKVAHTEWHVYGWLWHEATARRPWLWPLRLLCDPVFLLMTKYSRSKHPTHASAHTIVVRKL